MAERAGEHVIEAHDGWRLSVADVTPEGPTRAIVVAGHAMMVDRRTLWRANRRTLVQTLVDRGLRVLVPDLRGRGDSGAAPHAGGDWGYDDHVADVGACVALARRLEPGLPLFLLGHSLFAHAALAWLGTHPEAPVRGHVAIAANIWNRRFVDGRLHWWRMRLSFARLVWLTRLHGYAPTGRYGIGSADEARAYVRDMHAWVAGNRWTSRDGVDYFANEAQIRCPVLLVVSDGDRLYAPPAQALRFTAPIPRREVLHAGPTSDRPELRDVAPDHMPLVTDPKSAPLWQAIADWLVARAA